ncbi:hypothetical protein TNCV_4456721 [Trichonephila clavipes]|nr:hypothetical protein TNCV_4456721 [Trichonephila clavipes]
MACTGTDTHAVSTRCPSSSTIVTGVWLRASRSAIMDQTFSVVKRSGEHAGQGNSRTFSVSRKVRTIQATCGRPRNKWFCRARIKGRATGRNTREMFVVDHTIEDAPASDAELRVTSALVSELRIHADANVDERRTVCADTCWLANDPNS